MSTPLFLFIISCISTNVHFGNTDNGLGMIIGANGSYIEVGLYENKIAKSWKIEAYNDEGYYSESINVDGFLGEISLTPIEYNKFMFTSNFDGNILQKEISKSDRSKMIRKERRKFRRILKTAFTNISYNPRKIIQKRRNSMTKVTLLDNGDVLFEEKKDGSKEKYKINLFKYQ